MDAVTVVKHVKPPADYSKGKIYKIVVNEDPSLIYYGSTIQTLSNRMGKHRSDYRAWLKDNTKYECTSIELFKVGTPIIIEIEKWPCNDKAELTARERYYIENNTCVNKQVPGRTRAEYRADNPSYQAEYYAANTAAIAVRNAEWRADNPSYNVEYYAANTAALCEYQTKYYAANRDEINARKRARYAAKKAALTST